MIVANTNIALPLAASQIVSAVSSPVEHPPSAAAVETIQKREDSLTQPEISYEYLEISFNRSNPDISSTPATPSPTPTPTTAAIPIAEPTYKWLTFSATFYVKDGPGMNGKGITATGTIAKAGRTIAVNPKIIPYGTKVYIEGWGYRIAEDCGTLKEYDIDIFVDSLNDIPKAGRIKVKLRFVE